jgi:NAD-dependent SIR2 family protein deacetylase
VVNQAIASADALLVAGSSLMVYSGFRFCRLAQQLGKPLMIVNRGKTRADDIATVKITADCALTLKHLATSLV